MAFNVEKFKIKLLKLFLRRKNYGNFYGKYIIKYLNTIVME